MKKMMMSRRNFRRTKKSSINFKIYFYTKISINPIKPEEGSRELIGSKQRR